jgi:hypothetical protein
MEDVEEFWSARKRNIIKSKVRISYEKTQRLICLTGKEFDADSERSDISYIRQSCGLPAPQMSSNMPVRQIRKLREELNLDAGMDYICRDGMDSPLASNITAAHFDSQSCVAKRIWSLKVHLDFANEVLLQSTTGSA